MDTGFRTLIFTTVLVGAAAAAQGQQQATPPAGGGTEDPQAASSPHQRSATGSASREASPTSSPEAAAASSPHQHETTAKMPSSAMLKMASQDGAVPATFVKKAALDGMTEVELGKAAMSKSQDPKVRQFAQRMVADHGKANKELESIAKTKGLEVPKSLDTEHQSMVQMLNSKSGAAFDAAYSEHMNADHAKAVALFEGASKGTDAELAAFAKKTLPTLKEHKDMAESLSSSRTADASGGKTKHE